MRSSVVLLLMGAIAVSGCCKSNSSSGETEGASPAAKPMTAPPTPRWKEHELSFDDMPARATFRVKDFSYSMSFRKFPPGTHIVTGGKDESVNDTGSLTVTVDISEKIAGMAPKDATDFRYKLDPGFKITLEFPGGIDLDIDAPAVVLWFDLKRQLEKVKDHPVPFGKETDSGPAAHTILFIGVSPEVFGAAPTMHDVDWVAVREKLPAREGPMCHGYKDVGDKGGGKERSLRMKMQDENVAIFARRTGVLVERKEFSASNRCPLFASGGSPVSYPSVTEVKAWLRERAK
jgi:hypothetical protein